MAAPDHRGRLPTLAALDGIRALAIAGVVFYHGDILWVPGGLLGVEVFFVLSGYLITSLLWAEMRTGLGIGLREFWTRRARRLLPAVFVMIALVSAAFVLRLPEEVARIRGDVAAAASYTSNWYLIAGDHSYFSHFARPSPFGHLWSLAIEEQFYLLWPLVLGGIWLVLRRPARAAAAIAAMAAASVAALWLLYDGGDASRVYFGTDTRAAGLLIGSALALVWHPFTGEERTRTTRPWLLDAAVLLSGGFLVWAFMRFDDAAPSTYRPGLLLVSLATASLIAACVHPRARVGRLFGIAPLRAIGRRSYSIYLWYWPVFVVTRPGIDLDMPIGRAFAWRMAFTLTLAELSYRYVEQPARAGALGRLARRVAAGVRAPGPAGRRVRLRLAGAGVVTTLLISSMAGAMVAASQPVQRSSAAPIRSGGHLDEFGEFGADASGVRRFRYEVVAVGDSVMAGARSALRARLGYIPVHARVGLQAKDAIVILERLRAAGRLGRVVVIQVGNNGMLKASQFERMMQVLDQVDRVVFVTVRVPRRWESQVNGVLLAGVRRHLGRTALVAWRRDWHGCRGRVFVADGTHLTADGARCYASMIAAATLA